MARPLRCYHCPRGQSPTFETQSPKKQFANFLQIIGRSLALSADIVYTIETRRLWSLRIAQYLFGVVTMPRTMKELAEEAIQVQNAGNIVAVAHSFAKVLEELKKDHGVYSTEELRSHFITRAWVDHMSNICGIAFQAAADISAAHMRCFELAFSADPIPNRSEADEVSDDDLSAAAEFYDNLSL